VFSNYGLFYGIFLVLHSAGKFICKKTGFPGPYKSLKVLKFLTFKYKALKSP